jgi:uncharacterized protein YjeT (DUF2065 family)
MTPPEPQEGADRRQRDLKSPTRPKSCFIEARANIIWGEPPADVREFLISEGIPAAVAEEKIAEFVQERSQELRSVGRGHVLVGAVLTAAAGGVLGWIGTMMFPHGRAVFTGVNTRGFTESLVVLVAIAIYGLWRLGKGIIYLVRPQWVRKSIADMSDD